MIRPEEIAPLLASLRAAVADVFKPELNSDKARALADAALLSLDRMLADLRSGETIASSRLSTWDELRAALPGLGLGELPQPVAPAGFLGAMQRLQGDVDAIQQRLDEKTGLPTLTERLARGDAKTQVWFRKAVTALSDIYEASQPVVPKAVTQEEGAAPDLAAAMRKMRDALNAHLPKRLPKLPANPVTDVRLLSGGNCKQTALVTLTPNDVLPPRVVLRLDIANSITGTSVVDEYPYIKKAWAVGVKTPKPLLLEADASVLGGSFMLMEEAANVVPSGTYFPEDRMREPSRVGPEFGKEIAATLAYLHSKTRTNDASQVPDYVKMTRDSCAAWNKLTPKAPLSMTMDLSYAWLLAHPLPKDRPYCIVHGDFGSHNMLVRDGHLAAVVDWELAYIGDPADDLAQVRMLMLPGVMEWKDFMREYVAAGGDPRACDEQAVAWFCVSLMIKHGLFNLNMRTTFLRGERTDIGAASLITHYNERICQYQARALKIAMDSTA